MIARGERPATSMLSFTVYAGNVAKHEWHGAPVIETVAEATAAAAAWAAGLDLTCDRYDLDEWTELGAARLSRERLGFGAYARAGRMGAHARLQRSREAAAAVTDPAPF